MLFLNTEQRQEKIGEFLQYYPNDSIGTRQAFREIGAYARAHGDVLLELCEPSAWLRLAWQSQVTSDSCLKEMIDSVYSIYLARKVSPVFYASLERNLGNFYLYREKNYARSFEHFGKMMDFLRDVQIRDHPYKVNETLTLIYLHYDFEDYEKTIELCKDILQYDAEIKNRNLSRAIKMHMSYSFRDIGALDSSDVYINQVIKEARSDENYVSEGTAICYLGYNFYLKGDVNKATQLFEEGISKIADDKGMFPVKLHFASYLAKIYAENGQLTKANKYLAICSEFGTARAYPKERAVIYKNLSTVHAELGESKKALQYLDSVDIADRYITENYDSRRFLREQQAKAIMGMETEKARILFWRNGSIYFLVLLFVLSLFLYWRYLKKKQLQLSRIQTELDQSKKELHHFTEIFRQSGLQQDIAFTDHEQAISLQLLEEATILTKEEWEDFKYHFEKVYPEFFKKLLINFPNLTQGEIRFLCLKKLGLSNREMSETLGVSDQSIRTTLYRLRKKVSLSSTEDVENLIENL